MLTISNINQININEFDYDLPESQIAKFPKANRDQSKLLIYKNGEISQSKFQNLPEYLPEKSHLVFNNTKVVPARLYFKNKNDAIIEVLLLKPLSKPYETIFDENISVQWQCIIGNKKKWKKQETLVSNHEDESTKFTLNISYIDFDENIIEFHWNNNSLKFYDIIHLIGQMPLPPYLNRKSELSDNNSYQTIYSDKNGAVAAPTAGLHFTQNTFKSLLQKNITHQFITLHVGAGTFLPVKVQNAIEHKMHNEQIIFDIISIKNILANLENIIPVGTTSLRALESLYWFGVKLNSKILKKEEVFFIEKLYPYENQLSLSAQKAIENVLHYMEEFNLNEIIGETEILIFAGYNFKICKGLITNFHQPKSTLLLLVSALVGNNWKNIYKYGIDHDFKFLSYGDSSLLLP